MKVILTQELKGRGAEGDVVEVAYGFAVNYLFPRKIAIPATAGNLKQLEARIHNIRKRDEQRVDGAQTLSASIEDKIVRIHAKAGDDGKLFGSVTTAMIEQAMMDQHGIEVDRRRIETHGPIKETGDRVVEVHVYREIRAHLTVRVLAEGAVEVQETPAEPEVEEVVEETAEAAYDVTADDTADVEEAADDSDSEDD